MDVIWFLHGDLLSSARHALFQQSSHKFTAATTDAGNTIGAPGGRPLVSVEAFVTEIYRAYLARRDRQRPLVEGGRQLVERICCLFDLVDIDSTGTIDWEDFTDFCVYMRGGGEGNRGPGDTDGVGDMSPGRTFDNKDGDITLFTERLGYTDRSSHCHEIRSMRFVKELQLLMVVEGGPSVKIYKAGPHRVGEIEPAIAIKKYLIESTSRSVRLRQTGEKLDGYGAGTEGRADNTAVLAAEFIGHANQAAMSCADGYLTVWDLDTCKMLRFVRMRDIQVGLRFCPAMNVLASWGVDDFDHDIVIWNVEDLAVVHVLNDGHSDPVKDVCEVALPQQGKGEDRVQRPWSPILVTAGMDGKAVAWDLRLSAEGQSRAPRKLFILTGHFHGILSLAYSDEHDLIISAGFDFDALCWERSTRHMHMKLEGHNRSLIGVQIVRHETQRAVTGDEGGTFRLWEIRRGPSHHGTCLQTFSLSKSRVMPRTMVIPWREGLIVAGSKMHIFRAERSMMVAANPAGVWFSTYTGELYVLLRNIVIVDGSTGKIVKRTCQQPPGREITAFCVDARQKKAVVGDQKGHLRLYDGVTGRWVMSATAHHSEVSALLFIDEDSAFVSAGWDCRIQVHDATIRSSTGSARGQQHRLGRIYSKATTHTVPVTRQRCAKVLRSVCGAHDEDITLVAASARLGLLASASSDLTVRVWDYTLLRLEEIIVGHRQEITCVCFLDPFPCLATADMAGKVLIWATRPHPNSGHLLVVIRNTAITTSDNLTDMTRSTRPERKVLPTPVTSIAFYHSSCRTVTIGADDRDSKQDYKTSANRSHTDQTRGAQTLKHHVEQSQPDGNAKSTSDGQESLLLTGDELGTINVWDVTNVLAEKLVAATVGANSADSEAVPVELKAISGDKKTHQFVYHRDSPLDGVSLHAATRFKELIEIAKILRQGGHLPSTQEEADSSNRCRNAALGHDSTRVGSRHSAGQSNPSYSQAADVNLSSRLSHAQAIQRTHGPGDGSSASSKVSSYISSEKHGGRARPQVGTQKASDVYAQVEATLNAEVDAAVPVASWTGHRQSIIFIQVIVDPPAIVTGSLDGSARVFSMNGTQLGVLIDQNEAGTARWHFAPPKTGRKLRASARAAALHDHLESVRRAERRKLAVASRTKVPVMSPRIRKKSDHDMPVAPAHASGVAPSCDSTLLEGKSAHGDRNTTSTPARMESESSPGEVATVGRRKSAAERANERSALTVACLSRIKEVTRPTVADPCNDSESASGDYSNIRTSQEDIDARLMKEAREGQRLRYSDRPLTAGSTPAHGGGHLATEKRRGATGLSEALQHKIPVHLGAEQERKHAKRIRSGMQFLSIGVSQTGGHGHGGVGEHQPVGLSRASSPLGREGINSVEGRFMGRAAQSLGQAQRRPRTSPGVRTGGAIPNGRQNTHDNNKDDAVIATGSGMLRSSTSAPALHHAEIERAPLVISKLETSGPTLSGRNAPETGSRGFPSSRRSTATFSCAIVSSRSNASVSDKFHRRIDANRCRDGVRRVEENKGHTPLAEQLTAVAPTSSDPDKTTTTNTSCGKHGRGDETVSSTAIVGGGEEPQQDLNAPAKQAIGVLSDRVRAVVSRFERFVDGNVDESGLQGSSPGRWCVTAEGGTKKALDNQLREQRIAAKKSAIMHNNRYRRAKRFNLTFMRETQQRRQEATVGLSGLSGERFGPYTLDDVFDFQAFANHLGAQGADLLTVRGLINNPGVQDDPYTHALLHELARTGVVHWNQSLSVEDLMQLAFHFAKHEELKRITNAIEITLLLERVRDAYLAANDRDLSLVGPDGTLASHVASDIDTTLRATCTEASGTCTLKELAAMMSRAGSGLYARVHEELEALAAGCGVDGYKELTARDLTGIITKLAILQRQRCARQHQAGAG